MDTNSRGKSITASVPSIAVKFNANAEEIEELYASDGDQNESPVGSITIGGESDSSPFKYLPRLVKRSTSVDITPTNVEHSPPSDPWRFFSDIKGKITKSVEEKITEIKTRNHEEGSPLKTKPVKDSKDNSSVSDSEELSESSISRTCGIVSTTEGVEMSSEDESPAIENDRMKASPSGLRQRFRILKSKSKYKEGTMGKSTLHSLYNINNDKIEQALAEECEVESAVDALEDTNLNNKLLKSIDEQFDNMKLDKEKVLHIKEMDGNEVRRLSWNTPRPKTVFAPVGFVDFRSPPATKRSFLLPVFILFAFTMGYFLIYLYSNFLGGFMLGFGFSLSYFYTKSLLNTPVPSPTHHFRHPGVFEIPAASEIKPLTKHEGWVNEFPEEYDPHTYHISQTQSVFLRLQGNLLRLSHTKTKVPKRALWNEAKIRPSYTHHRVYNLLKATVELYPEGLAKKRHWSKKYPICITLYQDQMDFDASTELPKTESEENVTVVEKRNKTCKNTRYTVMTQRFSKLAEENEFDMDLDKSRGSSPDEDSDEMKAPEEEIPETAENLLQDNLIKDEENDFIEAEDFENFAEAWDASCDKDPTSTKTKLFIFGRTDREKEDWFRRLAAATHKGVASGSSSISVVSNTLIEGAGKELDYAKYMSSFIKMGTDEGSAFHWLNILLGRILFDCLRDDKFTMNLKTFIQRKLSSIKLPYFIEELSVTELSLGRNSPIVHRTGTPVFDDRGLWIDLDVTYEGLITLILQTKLNLMKLKQPPVFDGRNVERPAMFNSDVEDSAESTSDEESSSVFSQPNPALDPAGLPVQGLGGTSNKSKKFMKMVDKLAESKFFQAATENRYIKKAMEGVSNTDLRLKVEVRELVGTLVLNVPPPPSDRVWIGFRPVPTLGLSAHPIVGERNITLLRVTTWIEKKLLQEFQKLLVIPNMEDLIVPVMNSELPK